MAAKHAPQESLQGRGKLSQPLLLAYYQVYVFFFFLAPPFLVSFVPGYSSRAAVALSASELLQAKRKAAAPISSRFPAARRSAERAKVDREHAR